MSLAVVHSRALVGIESPLVSIEVHLANGLPAFNIVGLPEASVREAKDRVRSALINSHFEFPARRITVNMAPADLPKEGSRFDLAIAIGIIAASGQLDAKALDAVEMVGELALSGELRGAPGVLPFGYACKKADKTAIVPAQNQAEISLIRGVQAVAATHLNEVVQHLLGQQCLDWVHNHQLQTQQSDRAQNPQKDLSDIKGQQQGKRALEIAAAGGHNLLLCGPPGTGKTMLAERLVDLLPPLDEEQALECAAIRSVCGHEVSAANWYARPFRHPHHTVSAVALVGGGSVPKPGEISLAHRGILFLDELPEFERRVLDVLREPLESGQISISRAARQAQFPAEFQLVSALNPSPTGALDDKRSTPDKILRYLSKISGPLLDRIDLQVDVPRLPQQDYQNTTVAETSADVRKRVLAARTRQHARGPSLNARLTPKQVEQYCRLAPSDQAFLSAAVEKLGLSVRTYHKLLKVARSIADLADSVDIQRQHLAEALSYRAFDRLLRQLSVD